jgi:CTP:molybdopterin cytidylyltransferase MocA
MRVAAVIPAAGSGERFGGAKLRADVGGTPLIERTLGSLREAGVDDLVLVVGPETGTLTEARDVTVVVNPDPSRGMFSSLQAGLEDVVADAIVILPGDMPFVLPSTIRSLVQVFEARGGIVSPRCKGKRGHPIVVPPILQQSVLAADPSSTLHHVLRAHPELRIDLDVDDRGVLRDVDTREDLAHA